MNRVQGIQQAFIGKGMTPDNALLSAYKAMDGGVMKQAAVLSYMDVFLYTGILFLICIPFVMFARGKKKGGEKIDMSSAH